MSTKAARARINRANQIKAAKAARSMPTAILLEKKAVCDAKALAIVERLIEPQVDVQWMLENLQHINLSHMEDVAEERAITKICGYVLCDNPLTKVVNKKYSISAMRNKVYDVEAVKNYCCFSCYKSMTYIMEQMLTSPLWLRSYEEIPKFKIMEKTNKRDVSIPGVEVDIFGVQLPKEDLPKKKKAKSNKGEDSEEDHGELGGDDEDLERDDNEGLERNGDEELERERDDHDIKHKAMDQNVDVLVKKLKKVVKFTDEQLEVKENNNLLINKTKERSNDRESIFKSRRVAIKKENTDDSESNSCVKKTQNKTPVFFTETLTERLENNFSQLVTANTIKFLHGKKTEKQSIFKSIRNQEKYARLCDKLNQLDLDDLEDLEPSVSNDLRPAPHFEVLKEQAKDLVIKVNAFYKGNLEVEPPVKEEEQDDKESDTVIPLTDAHAPIALRKRIFLDKLDKVVPDLLPTLSGPGCIEYDYSIERVTALKSIVSTFNLTAKNIVFKTAEWTVVGLLMIKMLAFIDPLIKSLLSTKHAVSRISLILMSYDLEPDHLDNLLKSLIGTPETTEELPSLD
ncbi:putative RNA polymerase II subunit B1 CTD phosphatase rpap2 [Microplitis mediator]|uniref:putative RNA polymerase II subunit B1 CTD phosphatase rpap2 n=1 Tax=Microplitis mediator TaxID=375433 RepID=UPI002553C60E|nr:putative RNA polymerase II subunit B1 CTD phosphatase rpap2 [Microplitis mediator]XP_057333479.1 putative RNA polymerase II subunit B1 CTD phosphatase rpap2 [Microplitis mediator]